MPTESEIIEALQMDFFYDADAINSSDDPAFTITYQFEDSAPEDDFSGLTGWSSWTEAEENAVIAALEYIETFLNVEFVEVTGDADADLSLGLTTMPTGQAGLGGASALDLGRRVVRRLRQLRGLQQDGRHHRQPQPDPA